MGRTISGDIKAKRTGMGYRTLELGKVSPGTIKQDLERTGLGSVCFELGRTTPGFIERRFGRTVAGSIKNFGRTGLGDAQQLERIFLNNLTIGIGRTVADSRKIEFCHQGMGNLSYETDRDIGGFSKIKFRRQVSGDINYHMDRTLQGDVKQAGRVIAGFVRECGRVTPFTIQCGRVIGGTVQYTHTRLSV